LSIIGVNLYGSPQRIYTSVRVISYHVAFCHVVPDCGGGEHDLHRLKEAANRVLVLEGHHQVLPLPVVLLAFVQYAY